MVHEHRAELLWSSVYEQSPIPEGHEGVLDLSWEFSTWLVHTGFWDPCGRATDHVLEEYEQEALKASELPPVVARAQSLLNELEKDPRETVVFVHFRSVQGEPLPTTLNLRNARREWAAMVAFLKRSATRQQDVVFSL